MKKKKTVCELLVEAYTKLKVIANSSKELEKILETIKERAPTDGMGLASSGLLKRSVDERVISDVLCEIDKMFFGPFPTERLEGRYNRRVDLIAYLYIIVERYGLGNDDFSERGIKPFFEFCKNSFLADDFKVTYSTLNHRLKKDMWGFRQKLSQESLKSGFTKECWKGDIHLKNYKLVEKIFKEAIILKRKM